MPGRAFVLGGTGQIGYAVARRLAAARWTVTAAARRRGALVPELEEAGVRFVEVDRGAPGELARALGDGADVLVDVIPYTAGDAEQLLALADRVGSFVAISSASVYADAEGRTLDDAASETDFPALRNPIQEHQRTVEPGDATYSTRKVAMERALLEAGDVRATVVRPCAVHGRGSTGAREWFFVKRVLDGRRAVALAWRGAARFHTTSTANLAELVFRAAERPGTRVVNCGDPDPPTVVEISRAVVKAMEREWDELLLPGPPRGVVGETPWSAPRSLVLDMTEAEIELGYRPVVAYERAVPETCRWLVETTAGRDWREALPGAARPLARSFDYEAEDAYFRSLATG